MPGKMGSKFLNILGFDQEQPEQEQDTAYQEQEPVDIRPSQSRERRYSAGYSDTAKQPNQSLYQQKRVVSMNNVLDGLRMVVLHPQSPEDTQMVIDNLKSGKPVVLTLEGLPTETAHRVLDFVSGAIYAINGDIRKVSKGIFLLAPMGVDISGNLSANLTNSLKRQDFYNDR